MSEIANSEYEIFPLECKSGASVPIALPPPSLKLSDSVFAFSLHKAGSVLFDNVLRDLAKAADVPAISLDEKCFYAGVYIADLVPASVVSLLSRKGYLFHGFRGVHGPMRGVDLKSKRTVVLVRDPRDVLTSYYFSMKFSHVVPEKGDTRSDLLSRRDQAGAVAIDEFVLSPTVEFMHYNFSQLMALEGPNTKVFRYEDIIFDKERWVVEIAEWLELPVSRDVAVEIARRHDLRPSTENPQNHVRQVAPGNYKSHLAPETIRAIESKYADVMRHYGYSA